MTWGTFSRCPRCQSQGLKPLLHYVSVGLWDSVSQRLLCWICYISCHIHRPFTLRSVPLAHEETSYDALVPLSFHANYSLPASPLGFILLSWTKQDIRDSGAERGNIPRTWGSRNRLHRIAFLLTRRSSTRHIGISWVLSNIHRIVAKDFTARIHVSNSQQHKLLIEFWISHRQRLSYVAWVKAKSLRTRGLSREI